MPTYYSWLRRKPCEETSSCQVANLSFISSRFCLSVSRAYHNSRKKPTIVLGYQSRATVLVARKRLYKAVVQTTHQVDNQTPASKLI